MTNSRTVIRQALDLLTFGYSGTATSGSANALADSSLALGNNYFNGGIADIDTHGSSGSAAIDFGGLFKIATFSASIFTVTPSLPSYSGSVMLFQPGDSYVAWNQYSMTEMINALNFALMDTGDITDTIDLTSVANQTEYTLTVSRVVRVTLSTSTTDLTEIEQVGNWKEMNGKLVWRSGYAPSSAGYTIKVYYNRLHDTIAYDFAPGSVPLADIDEQIDEMRLVWLTAFYAARARRGRVESDDPRLTEFINMAGGFNQRYALERPNKRLSKRAGMAWL